MDHCISSHEPSPFLQANLQQAHGAARMLVLPAELMQRIAVHALQQLLSYLLTLIRLNAGNG
jgi:hypothetical protein